VHTHGLVSQRFLSFGFNNEHTFWSLFAFFVIFILVDSLIIFFLNPWKGAHQSFKEKKAFFAALIDFAIVAVCLTCFIDAEVQRCCHDAERRLAEESNTGYDTYSSGYVDYLTPPSCGCPTFGSRLYGGLGKIEPYCALVALRIFRFFIANRTVTYLDNRRDPNRSSLNTDPFAVFDLDEDPHGHQEEVKGTAAELWKTTVSKHPEIATKYGEFSSEILKTMLGIHIDVESTSNVHSEFQPQETGQHGSSESGNDRPSGPENHQQQFVLGKQYSNLTPEAQEVILAGKLGRTVKHLNTPNLASLRRSHGTIPEEEETSQGVSGGLLFELDRQESGQLDPFESVFLSPNARLVRSMRRCDRKLLPMLNHWTVVDVVLTQFEIVYFDATNADLPTEDATIHGTREALAATKGGKGLRLRDVAVGRLVVGRLELSEIESFTVEREMPIEGGAELVDDGPEVDVELTEWWKQPQHNSEGVVPHRAAKWGKIKEDRLRIQTVQGRTLYLRFYSDLEDAEHHAERLAQEDEVEGEIFKNNAFQWAQTVGRFLGAEKLKQSLPHFGGLSSEELRDYLVVHYHHADSNVKKGGRHRRIASTGDLVHRFARSN
jgi:hypothetical protein